MGQLQPSLPSIPTTEMARLLSLGMSLVPLGGGTDGKSPLLRFGGKERIPLRQVLAVMNRAGSTCYGIRLDGLAVVDCDKNSPALVNDMEARFGVSPVHIKTPRGVHLYYRATEGSYPNLRVEGVPVDIKRGASSYVMGPGSVRPDGGVYSPLKGILGGTEFLPLKGLLPKPHLINEGNRNHALTIAAMQMVELVDGPDELMANLKYFRDEDCASPQSIPDIELEGITDWAWSKRLEGNVYHGRNSQFRLDRASLDALKGTANASDAIALFVTLQDLHGHIIAKSFCLNHIAMKSSGHTELSRRRFRAARRTLEEQHLLQVSSEYSAGKHARSYRFGRIRPQMGFAGNVTDLSQPAGAGGRV